jgi:hypothetical protein
VRTLCSRSSEDEDSSVNVEHVEETDNLLLSKDGGEVFPARGHRSRSSESDEDNSVRVEHVDEVDGRLLSSLSKKSSCSLTQLSTEAFMFAS